MAPRTVLAQLLLSLLIAAGGNACAAGAPSPRYAVSSEGTEILDRQAGLVWRRCVEGMYWNGRTCAGTALTLSHSQATARAKAMAVADQKPWRLPQVAQLRRLAEALKSDQASFAALFPAAPSDWHWSASVSVDTTPVNPYNYGNVMQGLDESAVNRISFMHGWALNLSTGEALGNVLKGEPLRVRLVRYQEP